ncbi:DUF2931 family protein [Lysobacter sp. MMG2]|uniref:DUF2931 family protein n=1 Tax=Lysobacter sp. MMG2 TaxID=2801338 RepID=UPI001C22743E|nr:DUF2931 family protein [Lysobacter sp. MMG2]MBU8977318.1 DUF2931 family protein [Lysobacter sp. MMG2]
MKKWIIALLMSATLGGCVSSASRLPPRPALPYDAWHLGVMVPAYMEAWVETVDVVDTRGLRFLGAYTGLPVQGRTTRGWSGGNYGRKVVGADLPQTLYVRWQSLVEPQTYRAELVIPASAREQMRQRHRVDCKVPEAGYHDSVLVGVAPAGAIRVWLIGPCLKDLEILRAQAEVEPLGPYSGQSSGKYRPLSEQAKQYIQKNGIPYDSW